MQDVESILQRYRGQPLELGSQCPSADRAYSIRIANDPVNWISLRLPALQKTPLRPWGAVATIALGNGIVCYVSYTLGTLTGVENQEMAASTTIAAASTPLLDDLQYHVTLSLVRGHIHKLQVAIAPTDASERRQHAFDFDPSCLTSFAGCKAVCELMPSAWLDEQKEARANRWILPAEETNDPRCKKLVDSQ